MKEFFGINNVTFNDFLIETNFGLLRNKYINLTSKLLEKDMKDYPQYDENNIRQIIITIGNSLTGEYVDDVIKKVRFKEDFLLGLIQELKLNYKNEIVNTIKGELNYDIDKQYLFISEELVKLEEIKSKIPHLYHLQFIVEELDDAVNNLTHFLEGLKPKQLQDFTKDKIKFKIPKKDVCFIFSEFYKQNIIADIEDEKRLAELLEMHFLYYDKTTKEYKEMVSSDNYLKKLRSDKFRQPSDEVKELFNIK